MSVKTFRVDWYPHDSLLDFSELEADQIGVLMQIINLIYARNEPILNDPKFIGKKCNLGAIKCARIINILIQKSHIYITQDNKIGKKRCDKELKNVSERRGKSIKNGAKGADKRWGDQSNQGDSDSYAISDDIANTNTNNNQRNNTNNQNLPSTKEELRMFGSDKTGGNSANGYMAVFDIDHYLSDEARQRARAAAPGWDLQELYRIYNKRISEGGSEPPDNPSAAFPAWCKKYTKGKPPQ